MAEQVFNPYGAVTLDFEGTRYAGAIVTVQVDFLPEEQDQLFETFADDVPAREREKANFAAFGEKVLVAWNVTDRDGKAIPLGPDALNRIPVQLARRIFQAWSEAVWNIDIPLSPPTESGSSGS